MKHTIFILFMLAVVSVYAQPRKQKLAQDPKATAILDKISEKIQSYGSITADFSFIFESAQADVKDTLSGTFYLKGEKYKLKLPQMERIFDGEKFTTYTIEANEATIESPEDVENDINPVDLFTIYKHDFKYKFREEIRQDGRNLNVIDLFPAKVDKSNYSRIQLRIDKNKNEIYSFKQFNKDGNKTTIKLKTFKTNSLPDNMFIFNKSAHPGVYVEDMR